MFYILIKEMFDITLTSLDQLRQVEYSNIGKLSDYFSVLKVWHID